MTAVLDAPTRAPEAVCVPRRVLLDALTVTGFAVARRPALPILGAVLIGDGMVRGFDYEKSVRVDVPALTFPTVAVSHGLFLAAVKACKGDVALTVRDGTLYVGHAALPLLDVADYPLLPALADPAFTVIGGERLSAVTVAAGRNATLPTFTGVVFDADGRGVVECAATDRYRLSVATVAGWAGDPFRFLLPARFVAEVAKRVKGDPVSLSLPVGPVGAQLVTVRSGAVTWTTRVLDGEFPKFRALIPQDAPLVFTVPDGAGLLAAVKAAGGFAERNTPVRLVADGDGVTVSVFADGCASFEQTVPAIVESALTVAFNPSYLADFLAQTKGGAVTFCVTDVNRPWLIGGGDGGVTRLLMAVRLVG